MANRKARLTLVTDVRLWWYGATIVPILAVAYGGFSGFLPSLFGLLGLFALFFWIFSFAFAVIATLKKPPPEPRQ